MKIAIATDGERPAPHFGEAPLYMVYTVENRQVVSREQRAKPVCGHGPGGHAGGHGHNHDGDDGEGPDIHTRMSDVIADCQVVMAAGIPGPMYHHLVSVGLEPQLVDEASNEEAVKGYLAGA